MLGTLVVVLVIFASIVLVTQGKADETGTWVGNIMAKLGFGCKDIGTVDFAGFMAAIKEVHEGCKYNDECSIKSCQEMTMEIPATDTCYKVNKKVLLEYDLGELVMPISPTIFCEGEYPGSKDHLHVYCTPLNCDQDQCKQQDYFSVANKAKIKITSKKKGWIWKSIPVKVEIDGGEDYSSCGVPLVDMPCDEGGGESGSYCYIGGNKWCDEKVYNSNYYCAECIDYDSDDCERPIVDCDSTLPHYCHDTEISCPGFSVIVKVHSIDVEQKYADISAYLSGSVVSGSSNVYLPLEEEVCFDSNGGRVSPSSSDCKLDIYLEEIDTTGDPYKPKIIRGCYNR